MSQLFRPLLTLLSALFWAYTSTAWAFDYLQPLPAKSPQPAENPATPAKIALGKQLFFDPRVLGTDSQISCNHCHNLAEGGDDNRALSQGQNNQLSQRSAPSLWNIGFQTVLYWDGRAISLESQTLDHLRNPVISSRSNVGDLVQALAEITDYKQAFSVAFPEDSDTLHGISGNNIARALASFERTLLATHSAFDRYLAGDTAALSASAKRGMQAFNQAGCLACHFGANFAGPAPGPGLKMGDGFYELFPTVRGSAYEKEYQLTQDLGRFAYTGDPGEIYMWRVPPLRNIALTAPYFHNGSVATLEEAIRVMARTQFNIPVTEETVKDISAFLRSLTGEIHSPSVD